MGEESRGRVGQIREWYRSLKEPKHVEKASRRERWKRSWWQATSTVLSFLIAVAPAVVATFVFDWFPPTGYWGIAAAIGVIGLAFVIDVKWLFPWGFDRFDLVAPWQFRDAEVEENE